MQTLIREVTAAFLVLAPLLASADPFSCCREKELVYQNGETQLAGVLLLPTQPGEYPAAVILQGSGTSDRTNGWARMVSELFVSKGVAVLLTDKRGSGLSGGNWQTASFTDLALDGLAGLDALRHQPGIRKDRLGIIGLSQGGHIAPLAATLGPVQFVVNLVGGAVPMKAMLYHELEQTYRQIGFGEDHIANLQKLTTASFHYIETGQGWEEYLECRTRLERQWGPRLTESWPTTQADDYWAFWRLIHDFDPMPYWRETVDHLQIPSFIGYGELDELDNVPVEASVQRLRRELTGKNLMLKVYPGTGHSLWKEDLRKQQRYEFVDDLVENLEDWIGNNVRE